MNKLAEVFCDACGWPIVGLGDALVQLVSNDLSGVTAVLLVHGPAAPRKCTPFYERRTQLVDLARGTGHLEEHAAAAFLDPQFAAGLRDRLASRNVWPFARRLLARVNRLGRLAGRAALRAQKPASRRHREAA
jgi:hypothetical protein